MALRGKCLVVESSREVEIIICYDFRPCPRLVYTDWRYSVPPNRPDEKP